MAYETSGENLVPCQHGVGVSELYALQALFIARLAIPSTTCSEFNGGPYATFEPDQSTHPAYRDAAKPAKHPKVSKPTSAGKRPHRLGSRQLRD